MEILRSADRRQRQIWFFWVYTFEKFEISGYLPPIGGKKILRVYLYIANLRGILSREKVLLSNNNETDYLLFYSFCEAHQRTNWFMVFAKDTRGTIDYLLFL